uniref:Zinc finger and BTB domain containing 40 n=1 Tax=Podarcis muralis TaxID=64176 RepID=A0A670J4S3_PODMU
MDLPNYSQQLLQQLHTLCREQQFCDCSILVGTMHFRAHKLVLAAASVLFRSVLDGTDTVSIDASVVAPDEFALLLEMIYTGKLPPGKHNFTNIISVADSLQMFDVAVSCKTLLGDLLSFPSQEEVLRDISVQAGDASSKGVATLDSSRAAKLRRCAILSGSPGGKSKALPKKLLQQHLLGSSEEVKPTAAVPQESKEELLKDLTQLRPIQGLLDTSEDDAFLSGAEKQAAMDCSEGSSPRDAAENLFKEEKILSPEALSKFLGALKAPFPGLGLLLDRWVAAAVGSDSTGTLGVTIWRRDSIATEILLRHRKLISEALQQGAGPEEELPPVEEMAPATSWRAALSSAWNNKPLPATQICQLLCSIQEYFPGLQTVMQELQQAGLLTAVDGGKASVWKWKVNSMSQVEAVSKAEPKGGRSPEAPKGAASPKSFACKACRKSFRFYCRLKVHEKRCRVAHQKPAQCPECGEAKASKAELEKHQAEAHGKLGSSLRKKKPKKPRLPVACDICGREFAHTSGMQYHKLTEHFDEKPFSCEECGAKFAANSTLKNHQRLHTGDQPFACKHCLMSFAQASALAYHTKKKHAKGKMYACQYCAAVFAQSIELSRHVRTHTGDKPYVCRECGKGFRQANGLSIHLHTFHNIDDPYDCQKCQMSFPTLQEHQKHIHAAHSREYHPCPTCGKVFSAPSLLERHVVTHVGGKPFSCQICNKAYQQLSGLWYHNRTHHPDIFAAQNHRSSKFSSLQCSSCDKTFSSTAAHRRHTKEEHAEVTFHECEKCKRLFPSVALLQAHEKSQHSGSQPLHCPHCSASFHLQGALQQHLATKHTSPSEPSWVCTFCEEVFPGREQLEQHCGAEHPKVVVASSQVPMAQVVQVSDTFPIRDVKLTPSQSFVWAPVLSQLVMVNSEDLLDEKVTTM